MAIVDQIKYVLTVFIFCVCVFSLHLQELYISRNSLTAVPSQSLNGPNALKLIALSHNNIGEYSLEKEVAMLRMIFIEHNLFIVLFFIHAHN